MFWRGRRVLVAGGAGLIGSNLVARLIGEGAHVRATLHRHGPTVADGAVEYVRCDLTKAEDCRKVVAGMDDVFLCAASTSGAAVIAADPMVHVTPNILINAQVLEAAHAARVQKFLWLSSSIAYPPTDHPAREEELLEGDPYEAYFCAGWAKRFTEILCRMYGEKLRPTMTTIVLRPTNVYGAYDKFDPTTSHVTAALIRKVVERQNPVEVWGTGGERRDLLHVDDMVEAMIRATERLDGYQVINVGCGQTYSVKEILDAIVDLDGYTGARISFVSSRPSMIAEKQLDLRRAGDLLGFAAAIGLREGLARTIDWYREHRTAWQR